MKTQFSFSKLGFTLMELMVVIAIVGTIFVALGRFSFRPQENIVRAERLANKVQSSIHLSNVSVMMGLMDGARVWTTWANIRIGNSWSALHWMRWSYIPTSLTGQFIPPFFDNDPVYQIETIKLCVWGGSTSSWKTNILDILVFNTWTIFSWTVLSGTINPANANIMELQVRYSDMAKKIVLDRRTWRTEIRRQWEDLCN